MRFPRAGLLSLDELAPRMRPAAGEYQDVEMEVLVDGTLKYVVKSINLDDVPEVVLMTLKKTIDIEPSLAWSARTSLRGEPIAYFISIDANGLLRYGITADGKRVEKL